MKLFTDRNHLRKDQYQDSTNLNSRISLHEAYSVNPIPWQGWVFSQINIPREAAILELGSGSGRLWIDNAEFIRDAWSLFISDLSLGMIREAIDRIDLGACVFGIVVDAASIPVRNDTFDAVIANHMLFHINKPSLALREIHRILRTGGMIYATTVGDEHLLELRKGLIQARDLGIDVREDESAQVLDKFMLDTGAEKVRAIFQDAEVRVYEDYLDVIDVDPLIDYVKSSCIWNLGDEELRRLRDIVATEIMEAGAFRVKKHQGMIVARK